MYLPIRASPHLVFVVEVHAGQIDVPRRLKGAVPDLSHQIRLWAHQVEAKVPGPGARIAGNTPGAAFGLAVVVRIPLDSSVVEDCLDLESAGDRLPGRGWRSGPARFTGPGRHGALTPDSSALAPSLRPVS